MTWSPSPSAGVAGYKIYVGNSPGAYIGSIDVGNVTSFTFSGMTEGAIYYFAATAYDSSGNQSAYSNEISKTAVRPSPLMSHYRYNYQIGGDSNCGICHVKRGTFLGGFGVRTTVGLCYSCHGATGVGHEKPYGGRAGHPIFVNVTSDSRHRKPSLGFVNGTGSDKTYTHLYKGRKVVCMTCHNAKRKPGDPGRSWELTTTTDYVTYSLQYGGWARDAYLKPVVYRSTSLWNGTTYVKDSKQYVVPPDEYDTDMQNGAVVFHQAQSPAVYVYVTLLDDYLRNTNVSNQLCLDCHITTTHRQADCTACHGMHNTNNLFDIRENIRTPQGALKKVFFTATTAMSGKTGVCVVCHTRTRYHNITSARPIAHYNKRNCADCHRHKTGFPNIST